LYAVGGMGAGDVKLLGVVGSFLGPWGVLFAGISAMVAGAVFGIVAIIWRRVRPSLEFRATQMLSPGVHTMHAQAQRASTKGVVTQIAYAPAIATGAIVALWYIGYLPDPLFG